jgi:hypothetical protein
MNKETLLPSSLLLVPSRTRSWFNTALAKSPVCEDEVCPRVRPVQDAFFVMVA